MNATARDLSSVMSILHGEESAWADVDLPRDISAFVDLTEDDPWTGAPSSRIRPLARSQFARALSTQLREPLVGRVRHGVVHGVLSRRHTLLRHSEVIEALAASELGQGARVQRWMLDDHGARLKIQVQLPDTVAHVDGRMATVLRVRNDLLGRAPLSFDVGILRLVCSNGLTRISPEASFTWRHVGHVSEAFARLDDARAAARRGQEQIVLAQRITLDALDALRTLYRHGLLGPRQLALAVARIDEAPEGAPIAGARTTLWGVASAISAAARDRGTSEAFRLQNLAGQLVGSGVEAVVAWRPVVVEDDDATLRALEAVRVRWARGGRGVDLTRIRNERWRQA